MKIDLPMTRIRPIFMIFCLVAAVFALSSCYVPARFYGEIELSRNGYYKMDFEGYVVDAQFYRDLRENKLSAEEIEARKNSVINDFKRDSSTKEISYYGQGAFKVKWVKSGDILKARMVTFFQRNEDMLSIAFVRDKGIITIRGRGLGKAQADQLAKIGLNTEGDLVVRTDARVISQNATKSEKDGLVTVYSWKVKSVYDPAPKLVATLR